MMYIILLIFVDFLYEIFEEGQNKIVALHRAT